MKEILVDISDERRILDFRKMGFRDVQVLGRYRYSKVHPALQMHRHGDRIEICYLEKGKQNYIVEGQSYDLVGGDVFVTLPGEQHGTGEFPENRGQMYWMILNARVGMRGGGGAGGRFLDLPPTQGRCIVDQFLKLEHRHFRGQASLKHTLKRIFDLYDQTDDPLRAVNIKNLILRYLLDVLGCAARRQSSGPSAKVIGIQQYIGEHLDRSLCVQDLAELAGLSLSRFKARFRKEVGIPPGEYILRQKVELAGRLLENSGLSITDVAMQLGFSSSQYFATVFKRYAGLSPSDYRSNRK